MKKIFFLLSYIVSSYLSSAQDIAVANEGLRILYIGIDNNLSIAVENTPSQAIIVKATRGEVVQNDGKYIFKITEGVGDVDIIIYEKLGNQLKELGRKQFRVKRAMLPELKLGEIRSSATIQELINVDSIYTQYLDLDLYAPIEDYTIEVVSCGTLKTIKKTFSGNKITNETKEILSLLKPGDTLQISAFITLLNEKRVPIYAESIVIK